MLRPTHATKQFKANRVFSGRKEERDLFSEACNQTDTKGTYKVLNWYGVGGQGKSSLLREFQRLITAHNEKTKENKNGTRLIPAKIDFEDERLKRVDAALYSLRRQLAQSSGIAFHTFDAAFVAYHTKTRPGMDIGSTYPELFMGEKEGMMDLIDVLDDPLTVASHLASAALPGAGLIYKWGANLTGKLAMWWKTRGNELIAGIEALQPEQILEKLPTFLGIDLCDGIEAKPDRRPVVLLDTYEALWRNRGQKDGLADRRADAWVRLFVQDAPGTLFVIAGRDKLRWTEIEEAWGEVVDSRLLGALSDEDADQFLTEVPVTEGEVRAKIIDSSQGLPFYLDLQISHYETLKERGEAPSESIFGGTPSNILARFLEHLSDNDQATLRLASYLQITTREAMDELVKAFPGRAINYSFDHMVSRSSFAEISDDVFEIHALLKNELQILERVRSPIDFASIHRQLFEWADIHIPRDPLRHDTASSEIDLVNTVANALFHLRNCDPKRLYFWVLELRSILNFHEEWGLLEECYKTALENSEFLEEPEGLKRAVLRNNLGYVVESQGRLVEAGAEYSAAIDAIEGNFTSDSLTEKYINWNFAQNKLATGDHEGAGGLFLQLESWFAKHEPSNSSVLPFLQSGLAQVFCKMGDYLKAEPHARKAAAGFIGRESNQDLDVANSLHDFALILLKQARYSEAETLLRLSIDCFADTWYGLEVEPNPISDPSNVTVDMDITSFSAVSEPLFRKSLFNMVPRIFRPHFAQILVDHGADFRFQTVSVKDARTKIIQNEIRNISATRHPEETRIIEELKACLVRVDTKQRMLPFMEKMGVRFVVFDSDRFDLSYYHEEGVMIIRHPLSAVPDEVKAIFFYITAYYAAIRFTGFEPPHPQAGRKALASFEHGAFLDAFTDFAEAYFDLPQQEINTFRKVLNQPMLEFLSQYEAGASRDELYDEFALIYAVDHSERGSEL